MLIYFRDPVSLQEIKGFQINSVISNCHSLTSFLKHHYEIDSLLDHHDVCLLSVTQHYSLLPGGTFHHISDNLVMAFLLLYILSIN